MKIFSIIPARGGSKGIPGKNIKNILGKPLICYSIEAALESKEIGKIIVSSDSEDILEIAQSYSEIILHKRPVDLATDNSPVTLTVQNILDQYQDQLLIEKNHDAVMLLQPTAPIRTGSQIDDAINLFRENSRFNSLISVCEMDDVHPARMYWKEQNQIVPILKEYEETRRQEIPTVWFRNGSIYLTRIKTFQENKSLMAKPTMGFPMPASQLLNLDDTRDLVIAEALIKAWKNGQI